MSKVFEFESKNNIDSLIAKAKILAKENGIEFYGNTQKGVIHGKGIEGRYTIEDFKIKITIEKKPFFVSWSMIQQRLAEVIYSQGQS